MKTAEELYTVVKKYCEMFENKDYEQVDESLQNLDMGLPTEDLICIIRTTYPARYKLHYWEGAVASVKTELTDRGLNGEHNLRGLQLN